MKIGIIQASSQKSKNSILENTVKKSVNNNEYEVINFGIFENEEFECSYIETAFVIAVLLETGTVDFVVTGCSSGQGMMLACNSFPGVMCGFVTNPCDAYLFGRINNGNAISYPLGLNFGWAAEINLESSITALFNEELGKGYPTNEASRKIHDTMKLKELNKLIKKSFVEILPYIDNEFLISLKKRKHICDYIINNAKNRELVKILELY